MARTTSHWTASTTSSATQAKKGIGVVDSLLGWVKEGQGKPNAGERNLFMAAVAFTYGVWENYVEQLAIELTSHLSKEMSPDRIPPDVHQGFTKNKSPWEVSVSPGWQGLWVQRIEAVAIGEGDSFGLNTANEGQVRNLFRIVGIDPFDGIAADEIKWLAELVRLRGEIVHTAQAPAELKKADASWWRNYVDRLYKAVDGTCRMQCYSLVTPK